jgi:hypothetical protein
MADFPDVGGPRRQHHALVPLYRLCHQHAAPECPAAFAAWRGFKSPLRRRPTTGNCHFGCHQLWWDVEAVTPEAALALLPPYVAERTVANPVGEVPIP